MAKAQAQTDSGDNQNQDSPEGEKQDTANADVKQQNTDAAAKTGDQQGNLDTDNDRTKEQFDKLLDSNKKLYEANEILRKELSQKAAASDQFDSIKQPPAQNQQQQPAQQQNVQQQVNPADFVEVDPNSGERFINEQKLQSRIEELQSRASKAEEAVNKYIQTAEQREVDRQNREAFNAYPELNPSDAEFDVTFHNQTRAIIYDSLINPQDYGGKSLSFKDAADFVKTSSDKSEKQEGGSDSKSDSSNDAPNQDQNSGTDEELKQQASATAAGGQPEARQQAAGSEELQRLRMDTRLGSTEALAKRLAGVPHSVKADEGEAEAS